MRRKVSLFFGHTDPFELIFHRLIKLFERGAGWAAGPDYPCRAFFRKTPAAFKPEIERSAPACGCGKPFVYFVRFFRAHFAEKLKRQMKLLPLEPFQVDLASFTEHGCEVSLKCQKLFQQRRGQRNGRKQSHRSLPPRTPRRSR